MKLKIHKNTAENIKRVEEMGGFPDGVEQHLNLLLAQSLLLYLSGTSFLELEPATDHLLHTIEQQEGVEVIPIANLLLRVIGYKFLDALWADDVEGFFDAIGEGRE